MRRFWICLTSLFLSIFLLWPLMEGKFGIIDDHEIVSLNASLKGRTEGEPSTFMSVLLNTELGHPGETARYRPFYYFFRILKIKFFGDNAKVWFLWNFLLFTSSLSLLGMAFNRFFPPPVVLLSLFIFAALPFHADLWGRLGPAEIGACFWTSLFIFAAASYSQQKQIVFWALMCFAVFFAIGYKENFVLLLLPLGAFFISDLRHGEATPQKIACLFFPLAITSLVYGSLGRFFAANGVDIYGRSMSLTHRLFLLFHFVYEGQRFPLLLCVFSMFGTALCLASGRMRHAGKALITLLLLSVGVIGNYIFYDGKIFLFGRYALLEQLFYMLAFFTVLFPFKEELFNAWRATGISRGRFWRFCGTGILLCVFPLLLLQHIIQGKIQDTVRFDNFLHAVSKYDNIQIVNLGPILMSYEPYFSLQSYAKARRCPPTYYFPAWLLQQSSFDAELEMSLRNAANQDPAPPLTSRTALVEFSNNGYYRFIEHEKPLRDIDETLLLYGWDGADLKGKLMSFLRIVPEGHARRGRRIVNDRAAFALPLKGSGNRTFVLHLVASNKTQTQDFFALKVNGVGMGRAALDDRRDEYTFNIPESVISKSPWNNDLVLVELCLSPNEQGSVIVHSIEVKSDSDNVNLSQENGQEQ